jgi:hypothetical protein
MVTMESRKDIVLHAAQDVLASMVMGGVKTRIQDQIKDIALSIPSVGQGRQLVTRVGEGSVHIRIPVTVGQQNPAQLSLLYRTHQP